MAIPDIQCKNTNIDKKKKHLFEYVNDETNSRSGIKANADPADETNEEGAPRRQ